MNDSDIGSACNITNSTVPALAVGGCPHNFCVEDTVYRKVMGTILFVAIWPFVVQDMKFFPLGRPSAALLGATLMVVFAIAPQDQVFLVIGDHGNMQAICLLVGMMMLSHYYDREGILQIVALKIYGKQEKFRNILWKVCVLSAVLSAVITNDATCVVVTPLLLKEHLKQKRSPRELPPLLLGIATSANIGSASTFFGNPQNAYIASNANLSLLIFFITSLPAAIIGVAINTGLLYIFYFRVVRQTDSVISSTNPSERTHISPCNGNGNGLFTPSFSSSMEREGIKNPVMYDKAVSPYLSNEIEHETLHQQRKSPQHHPLSQAHSSLSLPHSDSIRSIEFEGVQETSLTQHNERASQYGAANITIAKITNPERSRFSPNGRVPYYKNIVIEPAANPQISEMIAENKSPKSIRNRSLREKLFLVWLGLATLLLIALLAVPPLDHVQFSLGLLPVGIAVLTMLADTFINSKFTRDVMVKIDWPIILMFFGLFVWLTGFENTALPKQAFKKMHQFMQLSTVWGVLLFTVFVIVGSNILSNVPLVILIIDELSEFSCGLKDCSQLTGVLLAWVSTIAGNFTLIGSVANLIVAEKARSCADYNLTFWEYLKFGLPSTCVVLFTGLPIVYFTSRYVNIDI